MSKSLKGKTIVNFGDSIFGNFRAPNDISTYIAELSEAVVYNVGFGGCRMGVHPHVQFDRFCMYRIADAVTSRDFSLLDEAIDFAPANDELPKYFRASVALLKSINFSKVDIATIAYGTNDFTGSQALDSENRTDIASFGGALRYSLGKLRDEFPHIKLVVCSQFYRYWMDADGNALYDSDEHVINGHTLLDFAAKTKEVADELGVSFIDNYHNSGINKASRHLCFEGRDGTHPAEYGRRLIADSMTRELTDMFGE